MHPVFAHGGRLAVYVAFWLAVGVLLAPLLAGQAHLTWPASFLITIPLATMYGFLCLSAWYVARSMPLGGTGVLRIVVTATTAALVSASAWLLFGRAWTATLPRFGGVDTTPLSAAPWQAPLFGFGLLLYVLSLAVGYVLVTFEHSREADRRGYEVEVQAREAELRALRAQLDPHFLFNSLHSISALTTADPPAARRMCVLLAEFLRESLAVGGETRITVAQELRLAGRFLGVERVRFGDRLRVEIESAGAEECLVPPLLLQPIVENAVTHGVSHVLEGGTVRIAASATDALLRILVENPCDPDRPRRTGAGVGLANVRARLRALHGEDAWLTASESAGTWRVEVVLPLDRASSSIPESALSHD